MGRGGREEGRRKTYVWFGGLVDLLVGGPLWAGREREAMLGGERVGMRGDGISGACLGVFGWDLGESMDSCCRVAALIIPDL